MVIITWHVIIIIVIVIVFVISFVIIIRIKILYSLNGCANILKSWESANALISSIQ